MAYEKKEYVQSDAVKQAQEKLAAQQGLKPGAYQSQWQTQLNDTMNKILNREDFKYDMNADALYQQLKDRTVNLGQQAMMDTMGQAAKLTGGYGNSYAQTVGQQAYQAQLQGLADRMPELYQLALDQYNRQGQDLIQKVGLLGDQDDRDYNRYLADYDMWSGERDYLTGRLDADRNFDYGSFRDTVADSQWQAEFDEALRQFNFANKLGEFAPKGGGGGGIVRVVGSPSPSPEEKKETFESSVADVLGPASADTIANAVNSGNATITTNSSGTKVLRPTQTSSTSYSTPATQYINSKKKVFT